MPRSVSGGTFGRRTLDRNAGRRAGGVQVAAGQDDRRDPDEVIACPGAHELRNIVCSGVISPGSVTSRDGRWR